MAKENIFLYFKFDTFYTKRYSPKGKPSFFYQNFKFFSFKTKILVCKSGDFLTFQHEICLKDLFKIDMSSLFSGRSYLADFVSEQQI